MRTERWFVAWMILAGLALGVLLVLAMLAAEELRGIDARLDHLDTYVQAPEPTPVSKEMNG